MVHISCVHSLTVFTKFLLGVVEMCELAKFCTCNFGCVKFHTSVIHLDVKGVILFYKASSKYYLLVNSSVNPYWTVAHFFRKTEHFIVFVS